MNVLINKKNIRRFLEFFEEENNSINGRVKSIEIEKKKVESTIEKSKDRKEKYQKSLEALEDTCFNMQNELQELENELKNCIDRKSFAEYMINLYNYKYIELLKSLSLLEKTIEEKYPEETREKNIRKKRKSLIAQKRITIINIKRMERENPKLTNAREFMYDLEKQELKISNLNDDIKDNRSKIQSLEKLIEEYEILIRKEEDSIESCNNKCLILQQNIDQNTIRAEKNSKIKNEYLDLFSEKGHIYEIEGEKYKIIINFINLRGDGYWIRFKFAPESSDIFKTKQIQYNKTNFREIVVESVRKVILNNRRNNEEKVTVIQSKKLDNSEQEEEQH